MEKQTSLPSHIAMVPTPGAGHIIPLTEIAKRFTKLNISVTILIPNDGSSSSHSNKLPASHPNISYKFLSPVDLTDIPPESPIETRIILTLTRSVPSLRDSLKVLSETTRLVALVVDLFGSTILDLAKEVGILPFIFILGNAHGSCFAFSFPKLDKVYTDDHYENLPEPVELFPGSVRVHGADFPDPARDRRTDVYQQFLKILRGYPKAAGLLINSFVDLEPKAFKYLMENGPENNIPSVYPVGPVVRSGSESEVDELGCLKWLDEQPIGSVIFVSFGSGGTLSHEQLVELALGLEMSGQRFLWTVRSPHDKVANASYFGIESKDDPLAFLPEGFLERTKGLGLVVPKWAPQVGVLSHTSTGGFLTHCGWNSTLESVVHGVPLIAWPLFAEQRFNANLLANEIGVAIRVEPNENGLITRDLIAKHVRQLIQGEEGKLLRERMIELKHAAQRALDDDGSSNQSLAKVAQIFEGHKCVKDVLGPVV